jgi:hypothetical protein
MEQITKICTLCTVEKPLDEFYNPNNSHCKQCRKDAAKEYYKNNSESRKEYAKSYNITNKEKVSNRSKLYNKKHKEEISLKNKERYSKLSKEEKELLSKKSHEKHEQYKLNPDYMPKRRLQNKLYRINNLEKVKKTRNIKQKIKYDSDPLYKLEVLLKTRLYKAFKRTNKNKSNSALKLVGCTKDELRKYLESQFKPEMNWENHGKIWEVDHILPIESFDLGIIEEQEKCFHYTNLQPLFKTTKIALSFGYNEIGNKDKKDSLF